MASKYSVEHAGALADVGGAGAAVTFTRHTLTVSDSTDVASPDVTSTVTGVAIEQANDRNSGVREGVVGGYMFHTSGLKKRIAATLFFVPDTIGEMPAVTDTVAWKGVTLTVSSVEELDIDGQGAIAATVVCER